MSIFHRIGDAFSLLLQMAGGNRYPTRHFTRAISRYYRHFKTQFPGKSESDVIQLVAAWRMSERATEQTRPRWFAFLKELKEDPQPDLKKAAVSMLCLEHGLDDRYQSDAIDRIAKNVDRELSGIGE